MHRDPVERGMKTASRLALVATLALAASAVQAADPVEGKDYFRIDPVVPTSDATKIVVTHSFRTSARIATSSRKHLRPGLRACRRT